MIISLVVAASTNNVIGDKGKLLWHLPADLKFFKNITWAMPVIMGRKTFESLGKPLPGRINIVITNQVNWKVDNIVAANSLYDAIDKASTFAAKEAFIIGGGQIYQQSLDIADNIYMTRVHTTINGDTFFPPIDLEKWNRTFQKNHSKDDKHFYDFSFEIWQRNK